MEYVEISKVIDIELGKTPSRNNTDYWNGENTWITIADMTQKYIEESKEKITDIAIKNTKIKKVPQNTVIMSFKLSIGKRAITKAEVYTNEAIAAFHIKDLKSLIPEYLYYALESVDFLRYTDKAVKGKTLNKEKLKKIRIPISSLLAQLKISKILNKIQKIIENKRKQIILFDELIKSRFIEMFGDESKFKKKKLNENVKEMFIGPFGSSLKNECFVSKEEGFCIVYEQKHAIKKTIDTLNRYVDKKKYEELKRFTVYPGDIIVSCRGTVGEIYRIPYNAKFGIMHPSIMKIRLNNEVYNVIFFEKMLEKHMKKILYMSQGSGIKMGITAKELGKKDFIVPPLSLQNEFAEFVTKTYKLKFEAEKSLKEMENLYESLMQKFFKQN